MKNSLSLFVFALSMMTSVFLFGQSKNSIERPVEFHKIVSNSFFSQRIKINNSIPTPFIMLSGFVEKENFKGQLFFRTQKDNRKLWSPWKLQEQELVLKRVFINLVV